MIKDCRGRAQHTGAVLSAWGQGLCPIPGTLAGVDACLLLLSLALRGLDLECHCGRLPARARAQDASYFLHCTPGRLEFNHTVSGFLSSSAPLRPASLVPPSPLAGSAHQLPLPIPRVPGWGGGEAGTAPRPHGRPSEPEAEGAPGGAGHRPAGPAGAELGPGAGLPWPPAGRGQPGELGNAVCPGEALSIVLSGYLRSRKCREADGGRVGRGPGDRRRGGG